MNSEDFNELERGRQRRLDIEKMKIGLLKKISIESEMQSVLLCQILASIEKVDYEQIKVQYLADYQKRRQALADWVFAEFGEIDLKDILPPDETDSLNKT